MSLVYIYSLSDPRTNEIRYVGKTVDPKKRMTVHVWDSQLNNTHKACWIKSLRNGGLRPIMEILEEIEDPTEEKWAESERWWICYLRSIGCRLTNLASGGNGNKRHSMASRKKMSESRKGRPLTHAQREARKNVKWTDERRKKFGDRMRGRVFTEEQKRKISESNLGRKVGPDGRARMSAAHKPLSPQHEAARMAGYRKYIEARKAQKQNELNFS